MGPCYGIVARENGSHSVCYYTACRSGNNEKTMEACIDIE